MSPSRVPPGMKDHEDPVRWEVAAQTRTLLSSNASLLESVASSADRRRAAARQAGRVLVHAASTEEVVGGSSQSAFSITVCGIRCRPSLTPPPRHPCDLGVRKSQHMVPPALYGPISPSSARINEPLNTHSPIKLSPQ